MYVGRSSLTYEPDTLPPKISNLPPSFAPSKSFGGARVKAAMRCGSVKVSKSWSAVVRNSCKSERLVTLTFDVDVAVEFAAEPSFCLPTGELCKIFGVVAPDVGPEPGACWISLPCSLMSVGASFCRCFRICGVISFRTRSFTGSFERSDE